ncbi:Hint domain-containing protein [Gymnodinialimonas ceratoperidinii]|uniref:Hint domain-containing protein n=1 Tax=Gymnodinialimonas ceratoperidinii TaxID=2856823 RepID=A0A8F6YA33_9RHOB|nr:Hint domain-containing protein [Gymnodinialimonas ceratoperidinii]QXT39158.1 Hint domain-containing protein [Gymnodinialimonas ceratoperidinii]
MSAHPPLFRFDTYPSQALRVSSGANMGDGIGLEDDALPGDIYKLATGAEAARLAISDSGEGGQPCVAETSDVGTPGDALAISACHMLMGPSGEVVEVLILTHQSETEQALHILPLSTLKPDNEYELVGTEIASAPERFADIASVSFLAGTHLTLANGKQIPVEHLSVGDVLLTRENGPQPVRWIGFQTRRAVGAAAPVRITEGTLNTSRDLRLSPQHRLFIWQRRDELNTGRAEVMVKAELLVNGDTVVREEGGHVDSYQIVFDSHEIIYAEGIAVESLLVTGQTRALLPEDLGLTSSAKAAASAAAMELGDDPGDDVVERLSRASKGRRED